MGSIRVRGICQFPKGFNDTRAHTQTIGIHTRRRMNRGEESTQCMGKVRIIHNLHWLLFSQGPLPSPLPPNKNSC